MKVTYSERSLYCDWYEQKTIENVKSIEPTEKGNMFNLVLENGMEKAIYTNCIVKIYQ